MNTINVVVFGKIQTIPSIDINHNLITSLVERWITKTHTFHLPFEESIITLENMTLSWVFSLMVLVTIFTSGNLVPMCQYLLEFIPPPNVIKKNTSKL